MFLQDIIQSMPHDAHPMGVLVSAMSALSIFHPDANPALSVSFEILFFSYCQDAFF
jgi:citrate synthase